MTLLQPIARPSRSRRDLLRDPAAVGVVGIGLAALLHLRDPHQSGSYGYCPFYALTGRPCPGCGGLRAVNDLTHGNVVAAMSSNLLAVALVVVLGVAWVHWLWRRWHGIEGRMITLTAKQGYWVIGVMVVFDIVRNTPWGSWLAP